MTFVLTISQVYTLTAPSEGGDEPVDPSESDLVVGDNQVTSGGFEDVILTFVAPEAGTYVFTTEDLNAVMMAEVSGYPEAVLAPDWGMPSYSVTLAAGQSINVYISDTDFTVTTWTLTITPQA